MRPVVRLILLGITSHASLLTSGGAAAQGAEPGLEASQPAGERELAALAESIRTTRDALHGLEAARATFHAAETAAVLSHLDETIARYEDPPQSRPPRAQDFQAWYLRKLKDRWGIDPLGPLPAWQQDWAALEAQGEALEDRDEALCVALHRLERLHDRLARQLGHAPEAPVEGAASSPYDTDALPHGR